jgi:hypothetical protein
MKQRSDGLVLICLYHFVVGAIGLLTMCGVLGVLFLIGIGAASSMSSDDATAAAVIGIIGLIVGVLFVLIAGANLVVGWGLWQRREWARIGAMGLAILRLLNIPLGTVVGVLIIWYLMQDQVKSEFQMAS